MTDGAPAFDPSLAFPKAVRVGQTVYVGGTTAAGPGGPVGGDDIVLQTREVIARIEAALQDVGAGLGQVVRTRIYVTDVRRWREIVAVLREAFPHRPAATMVGVATLLAPWLLVEIDADAVIPA